MNRKVIRIGMAVVLLGLVSPFAMASTITFDGEVTDQTCTFSVAGNTDPIVLLPSVAQSDLAGGVGNTAGETKFTIEVTGCTPSQTAESFKTVFLAVGPVTTNGNLDNTSANGATGVSLQLFDDAANQAMPLSNGPAEASPFTLEANSSSTSATYTVRYYSESTAPTVGPVSGAVMYAVRYE